MTSVGDTAFSQTTKDQARERQGDACAWCGQPLATDVEYHHVVPAQSAALAGPEHQGHFTSVDDCVAVHGRPTDQATGETLDPESRQGCHWSMHAGDFGNGAVPAPSEIAYSHRPDIQDDRPGWIGRNEQVFDSVHQGYLSQQNQQTEEPAGFSPEPSPSMEPAAAPAQTAADPSPQQGL